VGLIGSLLVAIFINIRTRTEFERFLLDRRRAQLTEQLTTYYQEHGNWEGAEDLILRARDHGPPSAPLDRVFLLGKDREVIVGPRTRPGRPPIPLRNADLAIPLRADGQVVGWLAIDAPKLFAPTLSPEALFQVRVRQAALFSALAASLLALLVGVFLARSITKPVRELTAATRALADGELGRQVEVRGRDEIAQLATAFNRMSADLARSNQLRQQMTADIAHDLRTPLSVILGYTEALSDGKLTGSPRMYEAMYGQAQQLSRLVADLRTLSLADAGELSLNRAPIQPWELLARVATAYQGKAQAQGVTLEALPGPDLPTIEVDSTRMDQALGNLVSNALRYTPPGGRIILSAELDPQGLKADDTMREAMTLKVKDTGVGIDEADLPLVFERFYRGDKARHESGESGLGLPIVKSLVEAHGGRIAVHSAPGEGTTFTITLPIDRGLGGLG
jgi:signal transduction histidine kinase